ncbi:TetR/AcrR family transcriptional regulator [Saccharopolyspora rhizosphaerae]|uniref:TetR/AcrR family transcriptional regulator n=1 Tax=Saccharopolyspora rhizosphaerae TaxID=2492662 RepID=A0A426K553_9PSEU|nr:TetR/AcrR family transcriptional regulator [Saccharopolyspora rhizosphaerae]RRO20530.1 TetR/AcrR family transcriptional regulator [Saccharopolyspora rhizosphaerae]
MAKAGTKGVARAHRERQILDIAGRAFAEHGYAGTSLAGIAADAGISKPLIYNYFGSKEGLYSACLTHAGETVAGVIERTDQLGYVGPEQAVLSLDRIFTTLHGQTWMWRLLHDPTRPATPEIADTHVHYQQRMHTVGAQGVADMLRKADNHDPLDASALTAAWVNVFDALVTWWTEHPGETPQAMTERAARLFTVVFGPLDLDALPLTTR